MIYFVDQSRVMKIIITWELTCTVNSCWKHIGFSFLKSLPGLAWLFACWYNNILACSIYYLHQKEKQQLITSCVICHCRWRWSRTAGQLHTDDLCIYYNAGFVLKMAVVLFCQRLVGNVGMRARTNSNNSMSFLALICSHCNRKSRAFPLSLRTFWNVHFFYSSALCQFVSDVEMSWRICWNVHLV